VARIDEDEREITERWQTKGEVSAALGKSLAAVTRLQKSGRLNPKVDDNGNNRYDPKEVAEVLADPNAGGRANTRGEEFAEYQLDTVRALIGLVKDPRERIDDIQFKIIDRLMKENEDLHKRLEANRIIVDEAKDNTADRQAALGMMQSETRVKELAGMRMVETLSRLMSGGKQSGVQLSVEQLEELVLVDNFLNDEQLKAAKAAIVAQKSKAKTNGNVQVEAKKEEPKKEDSVPIADFMKAATEAIT
jgi:hypothetical protein